MAVGARAKTRATTIADVARIANVVPSTVSHALNGTAPISEEVRERILRIARELHYRPSAVARSLLSGRTMTVGMLVADILDPHCPDIVGGVEAALAGARHDLMLCSVAGSPDRMAAFLTSLASKCVDAVIVLTDGLSPEMLASVAASPVPAVLVTSAADSADAAVDVTPDLMVGLRAACQHLRELGHRQVALMTNALSGNITHEGIAIAAWEQSGGSRHDALIIPGNPRLDGGRVALEAVLAARPRPTALIAVSDMAAIGVIQGAEEQGLRIPQFLSVIGIGDIVSASLVNPPLTTVALPRREIGVAAAQRALGLLAGETIQEGAARGWLPTSLIIRRSTGIPPRM
ncbi:MAG TPA: LacI family DNA-binding transcriptional regulator [Chloroflexota bacterium]|nr:LacI family DNA-binding transcriptional regulator [Chloroflexota bacterium]